MQRLGMRFHKDVQYPLGAGLPPCYAGFGLTHMWNRRQLTARVIKEVVGIHVLLIRSLFADGIRRRLLLRVSQAKPTSAPLRF